MRTSARLLLLAAVLGVLAGTATALVAPRQGDAGGASDPLGLGVPLRDLGCTKQSVLVVGFGETSAPLAAAVADNADADVHYLRTSSSCATLWAPVGRPVPSYVAYLGPYDDLARPCAARMGIEHKRDNVTRLRAGNVSYVKCICELPPDTFPVLSVGMSIAPSTGIWVRALQGTLADTWPTRFTESDITGVYDQRTADRIRAVQAHNAVATDGVVDEVTWRIVRDRACGGYDY